MNPVYRFTYHNKIIIFGIFDKTCPKTLDQLQEYVERWAHIKFFDGTKIDTSHVYDLKIFHVNCPVQHILFGNGEMAKVY